MPENATPTQDLELEGVLDDDPKETNEKALGPARKDTGTPKKDKPDQKPQAKKTAAEPIGETGDDEPGGDDDTDIAALFRQALEAEEAREGENGESEAEPEAKPKGKADTASEAKSAEKLAGKVAFTAEQQAHIDRLIQDRLSRDRAARERETDAAVKAATGMGLAELKQKQVDERASALQYEKGLDEETARAVAQQEHENRELKAQQAEAKAQQERYERQTAYVQAKAKAASDPLLRLYETEVDALADHGAALDFDGALTFILGQKLRSGDLLQRLTKTIQSRTLKQISERGRVVPESGGSDAPAGPTTTPYERKLLRAMGVQEKDYLAKKARNEKKR